MRVESCIFGHWMGSLCATRLSGDLRFAMLQIALSPRRIDVAMVVTNCRRC